MIKKRSAFLIIGIMMASPAFGEYRVYQYYVRSKIQNLNPPKAEIVTSTLNPISYVAYNGGHSAIEVNLLRSWVCLGNTSKQSICSISSGDEFEEDLK